jgi:uncharacterized membrane protein YccC
MALQMAVALTAAFVVGHLVLPDHWIWVVLTAYIVCSGNRGRGDVLHKSIMRVVGAGLGTVVATGVSGLLPPGDSISIVVLFVVLGAAVWLRPINYGYWAACVTAALALLYGYFGQGGVGLLGTRLMGILVGAVIGAAATWLILPVKTTDVLRRRQIDALVVLSDFLVALRGEPWRVESCRIRFDHALDQMDQVARTLRARDVALGRWRNDRDAAEVRALHRCAGSVHTLTRWSEESGRVPNDPAVTDLVDGVSAVITGLQQAAEKHHPYLQALPVPGESPTTDPLADRQSAPAQEALVELRSALHSFAAAGASSPAVAGTHHESASSAIGPGGGATAEGR